MRILQLIDSLNVGGAERIAMNYANALAREIEFSGLVATRREGSLKSGIEDGVSYLFIDKKQSIDLRATARLKEYCKKNRVGWVHAHGTSFFTAFVLKVFYPKIKIVWHEHKGARSSESLAKNIFLWICSRFFAGIIVVDHSLERWCREVLNFKKVLYLPNFTLFSGAEKKHGDLLGQAGKRIICVANLRAPKNHQLLIQAAAMLREKYPDWSFHLIGNDFDDAYSKVIKESIRAGNLGQNIFIYGLRNDTGNLIAQADIAVLTSVSEGLPVALLEYGLHGKAVVATAVGEIPQIIEDKKSGLIVASGDDSGFAAALALLIENPQMRAEFGATLRKTIEENHSERAVIARYLEWLNTI